MFTHLVRFLHYHEPPARIGERAASTQLYPTRGRTVVAAPKTAPSGPAAAATAPALTHREETSNEHDQA